MIYSLRGTLIHHEPNLAVIECGGVGYACRTSYNTVVSLGDTGKEVRVYTQMIVREDSVELFGFATLQELNCFRLLISVKSIGPKAATAILSDMTPEQFAFYTASGDSKAFSRVKGIGAKTAQRIVLELKDKVGAGNAVPVSGAAISSGAAAVVPSDSLSEALEALMVLGYSQSEAAAMLSGLDPALPTQELIKEALKPKK
ncbi:MAG: Holliday junction branch migration protein RuvA [Ruminococcus sp.]|nr:Holliday junction branch migration protein RuvA [Ruminococcus sp.]MBR2282976.1 Holliday junction branch migration protein RuvA [Ruminococcus sp.]